jgi:hypothetical protein
VSNWSDHFNTYQDACDYYGCDGPRELEAEAKYLDAEAAIETQDLMEAFGGPLPRHRFADDDEIPF